jgi:hypothetical protein
MKMNYLKEKIANSLWKPTSSNQTRLMQLSHNLNKRAEMLEKLNALHRDLNSAIMCREKYGDREPLDEIYTELDYLIQNEKNKLLQETKSSKR